MRKIFCRNCNKQLSVGFLEEVSNYACREENETVYSYNEDGTIADSEDWLHKHYWVQAGKYLQKRARYNWPDNHYTLHCNPEDLTLEIPQMPSGHGCCNWDHGDLMCTCGSRVGIMHLDCWMTKRVVLSKKKVWSEIR